MVESMNYTQNEASQFLGVSVRHLRTLTKRGEVPYRLLGSRVMYPKLLLERFMLQSAEANVRAAVAVEAPDAVAATPLPVLAAGKEA